MNRGDTSYLMLQYSINGEDLTEDTYDEIELTINEDSSFRSVKKLLSKGEIEWGTLNWIDGEGQSQTFMGYYAHLSQEETFRLQQGENKIQLRILWEGDVGSSAISSLTLGQVLSNEVLDGGSV